MIIKVNEEKCQLIDQEVKGLEEEKDEKKASYIKQLDKNIMEMLFRSFKAIPRNPAEFLTVLKMIYYQKKAASLRKNREKEGLHIPPFMIMSITGRCNLRCKGCYASENYSKDIIEMDENTLRRVLTEAGELGSSIVLLAGGEPFMRPEILEIARDFPRILFPVFTNGLLLNEGLINRLKKIRNLVPIISLEGHRLQTDDRRGKGVFDQVQRVITRLKRAGILCGVSFTLTNENFDTVTDRNYIKNLYSAGARVFFFVEYVPVSSGTEELVLTETQQNRLIELLGQFRSSLPGIFIGFPGDEKELGGCLAAGRGFIHINPQGKVEPCPFAPYSDTSLGEMSLKEALSSKLLKVIRNNQEILEEAEYGGGCTLWTKRELVQSLLETEGK